MRRMVSEVDVSELQTFSDQSYVGYGGYGEISGGSLDTFAEMWYQVFLWSLFSSIFVHTCAALISFATLRKHKFGKFFPIFILVMGIVVPTTSGVLSGSVVAFVYKTSALTMSTVHAMLWGIGQTVLSACLGFTRILATL